MKRKARTEVTRPKTRNFENVCSQWLQEIRLRAQTEQTENKKRPNSETRAGQHKKRSIGAVAVLAV